MLTVEPEAELQFWKLSQVRTEAKQLNGASQQEQGDNNEEYSGSDS